MELRVARFAVALGMSEWRGQSVIPSLGACNRVNVGAPKRMPERLSDCSG